MSDSPCEKIKQKIKEIESIPLYDVKGGRQRNSGENELLMKLRINYRLCEDHVG